MHVLGFSDRPEPRRVKELDASVDLLAILGVIQRRDLIIALLL